MLKKQKEVCQKYNAKHVNSFPEEKLGIASNVREGLLPINGLRVKSENGTCGWYIWAGEEFSTDNDFFKPLHVKHINEWNENIEKFLGLPPGWRFLFAGDYEDVWFDETLLNE